MLDHFPLLLVSNWSAGSIGSLFYRSLCIPHVLLIDDDLIHFLFSEAVVWRSFAKFTGKALVPESLFKEVAELQLPNDIKARVFFGTQMEMEI